MLLRNHNAKGRKANSCKNSNRSRNEIIELQVPGHVRRRRPRVAQWGSPRSGIHSSAAICVRHWNSDHDRSPIRTRKCLYER